MIYDTDYGVYETKIGATTFVNNESTNKIYGRTAINFDFDGGKRNDDGSFDIDRFASNGINEIGLFNFWTVEIMKHFTDLIKNSDSENDDPENTEKLIRYADYISFLHDLSEKFHYAITELYRWESCSEKIRAKDGAPLKETVFPQDFEPQQSRFAEPNLKDLTAQFATVMENPFMPGTVYDAIAEAITNLGGKSHRKFTAENALRNFEKIRGDKASSFYTPPNENSNEGIPAINLSNFPNNISQAAENVPSISDVPHSKPVTKRKPARKPKTKKKNS